MSVEGKSSSCVSATYPSSKAILVNPCGDRKGRDDGKPGKLSYTAISNRLGYGLHAGLNAVPLTTWDVAGGEGSCPRLDVALERNLAHLGKEQDQEERISDFLLRFEPPASVVALSLEPFRVPYGWVVPGDIALRNRSSGICILRSGPWVVRGLTTILPTHGGSGCERVVVFRAALAGGQRNVIPTAMGREGCVRDVMWKYEREDLGNFGWLYKVSISNG